MTLGFLYEMVSVRNALCMFKMFPRHVYVKIQVPPRTKNPCLKWLLCFCTKWSPLYEVVSVRNGLCTKWLDTCGSSGSPLYGLDIRPNSSVVEHLTSDAGVPGSIYGPAICFELFSYVYLSMFEMLISFRSHHYYVDEPCMWMTEYYTNIAVILYFYQTYH